MQVQDWFGNGTWSNEIETRFFQKLARTPTSNRSQYLRIQAAHLQDTEPAVSLRLIDQFFMIDDPFDKASAYWVRANAYQALGKTDDAIQAYRDAIAIEELKPSIQTNSWLELSILIVTQQRVALYDEVWALIDRRWNKAVFAVQHFQTYAALAIISQFRGDLSKAKAHAIAALEAAEREDSGLSQQPMVGLVGDRYPELRGKLKEIALRK